ncbi:LPXTG-site transpeptidase family protein [Marinobacter nitratireducens]|uniref:LPXTG-site transpeptidase family protein n=1 Tax=Marinobacter nitratireducens TaxID=1137280 RepID=A0A072N125_9GAMM|nr:class GN sortase [Marinobacter nitratireducens]KEF30932.1 LPXTG-site transpeptidase family protein [Marinobacter nitratireducens]TNE97433.1 MAG: class GN sortase [Gammaproteobacteria bacterium]
MSRLLLLLFTTSATLLVFGLWIPIKAVVAQELLELAWAESQARQLETRPWPWADTWPVARLTMPGLGDSMIVLAGGHGESLAFGPGQVLGNESGQGPLVIAGHRDTHFRKLRYLEPGSELRLQDQDSGWHEYRVLRTRIVDSRIEQIDTLRLSDDTLLLVTCYPFDSVDAGGPLRYVVEARAGGPAVLEQKVQTETVVGT